MDTGHNNNNNNNPCNNMELDENDGMYIHRWASMEVFV